MLTFAGTEDRQSSSLIFVNGGSSKGNSVSLISDSSSSLLSLTSSILANDSCEVFCSFYSGPSDSTILAFGESYESCGSIAYDSVAGGSFGYSGASESCGSIASASCSSDSSFSGSSCSYSC